MTIYLDLDFIDSTKTTQPMGRWCTVYIKTQMTDQHGKTVITPHCFNYKEIDGAISQLVSELEELRTNAKKSFAAAKKS